MARPSFNEAKTIFAQAVTAAVIATAALWVTGLQEPRTAATYGVIFLPVYFAVIYCARWAGLTGKRGS